MDIRQEITRQVERLPPAKLEQVLHYVVSLSTPVPVGEQGSQLRQFSGSLDLVSAQQMSEAIERECEQVDASQW